MFSNIKLVCYFSTMLRKRFTRLLTFMIFASLYNFSDVLAQSGHSIGFSIGGSNFLGDLGGANNIGRPFIKDIDYKSTRPSVGLFYKYYLNEWIAFKGNVMYTTLTGDDKFTYGATTKEHAFFRRYRNLNFKSPILALDAQIEINLYKYIPGSIDEGRFAPFIGVGGGGFWFNPRTKDKINGENVRLQPLGTEGQGLPGKNAMYKLIAPDIVASFGIKYNIGERLGMTLQVNYHHTFTDYIDDVSTVFADPNEINTLRPENSALVNILADRSPEFDPARIYGSITEYGEQRGDPTDKDQYLNIEASFNFFLGNKKSRTRKNMYSCPTW